LRQTAPQGKSLRSDHIRNFYQREWLPMPRRLGIRARPFYNTRHTYISTLYSLGRSLAFICAQTGTSPAMVKRHYGRYLPRPEDDLVVEKALAERRNVKPNVKPSARLVPVAKDDRSESAAQLRIYARATHRSRTDDLLITNSDQDQTEENQEELSPRNSDDPE
jgi:hypothetical protein